MAIMVPVSFDSENTPPGEQKVFRWLEQGSGDWVIFHQLDLAPWNGNRKAEIDFLVLIPDQGFVVIEVKSHPKIYRDNRGWHLGNKIERSPLKQADDAVGGFHRRKKQQFSGGALEHIPVVRCVIFPEADFEVSETIEWRSWEILDRRICLQSVHAKKFCDLIRTCLFRTIEASPKLKPLGRIMTKNEIQAFKDFIRPVLKSEPSIRELRKRRRDEMDSLLREQQKPILQMAKINPRMLVTGAAGTGKTLIAQELALQLAESGKRTGLFCFNRGIGDHLHKFTQPKLPNLVTGSVHSILCEMMDITISESADSDYWNCEFPRIVTEKMNNDTLTGECSFDCLVIDEFQDFLIQPGLLDCFETLTKGGLNGGNWYIFGDLEHQVLGREYHTETFQGQKNRILSHRPAVYHLRENCRNYEIVVSAGLACCGLEGIYDGFMRGKGNINYLRLVPVKPGNFRADCLIKSIQSWKQNGVRDKDIVILSGIARAQSTVATKLNGQIAGLHHIRQKGQGIRYASVHEFKGLESEVVILTDLNVRVLDNDINVLYTGITRALSGLSIVEDQDFLQRMIEPLVKEKGITS